MKIYYTDHFVLPLPKGHRFPMEKYSQLRQRVEQARLVPPSHLCSPPAATDSQILLAHDAEHLEAIKQGRLTKSQARRLGFPWSEALVERSRRSTGATLSACRSALEDGIAINLAGGTHHAFPDAVEGFCVFNDSVIALRVLQQEKQIERGVILDCDVHQGNGTAVMVRADASIFAFSIHGSKNFPLQKCNSDLDIGLPDDTEDEDYLQALEAGLAIVLRRARADLAIYLAGADPFAEDRFGRVKLSKAGLLQRDRMVLQSCRRVKLPVAITMAGGYAKDVRDTVDIHFQTVQEAMRWV